MASYAEQEKNTIDRAHRTSSGLAGAQVGAVERDRTITEMAMETLQRANEELESVAH